MLMRVADHLSHAWQSGDFFRSSLRVAAGDHNLCVGILAMNATDGGAGVLIRRGGDGAGVEDDESGLGRLFGALQAAFPQLAFDARAVRLRGPAAEICHVESCHVSILT